MRVDRQRDRRTNTQTTDTLNAILHPLTWNETGRERQINKERQTDKHTHTHTHTHYGHAEHNY